MDIKKAASTPVSIEQTSSTDKTAAPSGKTIHSGISSNKLDSFEHSSNTAANKATGDPNALVQSVLRESYLQTTEDLKSYAEKVKHFNEQKKQVREHLSTLKNANENLKAEFSALQPGGTNNVMDAVAQVLKESVQDTNEDKKYYLNLLSSMNKTNEGISEILKQITDASEDLAAKKKDDD
jgi:hypothetical protein